MTQVNKMDRIIFVLIGFIMVILGLGILFEPRFYSFRYNYHFDLTGYNIPLGIFIIVVGILFIWRTLKKEKTKG